MAKNKKLKKEEVTPEEEDNVVDTLEEEDDVVDTLEEEDELNDEWDFVDVPTQIQNLLDFLIEYVEDDEKNPFQYKVVKLLKEVKEKI